MAAVRDFTLVCGGGGVWGLAWMTGLAMGLAESGFAVRQARAFVGTSAGAVLAAQLASGVSIEALFERQADVAKQTRERAPPSGALEALLELRRRGWGDEQERLRATCALAAAGATISAAERRADIVERLGLADLAWPRTPLAITALDTETLDLRVFDAASGVSLADAVSASCAVPGVWPPMPIDGRLYVDGGVWRTAENAHLAANARAVVVLSPMGGSASGGDAGLAAEVAELEARGAKVVVICADTASLRTMAGGALDPAAREPAAEAGRLQGAREAEALEALLGRN
jgi:NTE family protein